MGTNESWLRVTTFHLPPDEESAVEYVKATVGDVTRLFRSQPGYTGGYWGASPEERIYTAVLHWSSLEAIEAASEVLQQQLARRAASGFQVKEVRHIQVTAVWREARRQEPSAPGQPARVVERPLQLPASGLVSGHPHQSRVRSGSDEAVVETQLRLHYARIAPEHEERALAYVRSSGPESRILLQAQPGFKLGYAGRVQGSGLLVSLTYWADPEALQDAEPLMDKFERERAEYGIMTDSVSTFGLFAVPSYVKPQMAGAV